MTTTQKKQFLILNSKRDINKFKEITSMSDRDIETMYDTVIKRLEESN